MGKLSYLSGYWREPAHRYRGSVLPDVGLGYRLLLLAAWPAWTLPKEDVKEVFKKRSEGIRAVEAISSPLNKSDGKIDRNGSTSHNLWPRTGIQYVA